MTNGKYAKPGAVTPGFARLLWRAVASVPYRFGLAIATNCVPLFPVAFDGAASLLAAFWGARP